MDRRKAIASIAASPIVAVPIVAAPIAAAATNSGWKNQFAEQLRDDFAAHWKSTAEYSLECVEAMPAEHFSFRPVDEQRTFAEQLVHFAASNRGYFASFEKSVTRETQPQDLSKAAVREYLRRSFDATQSELESLTEEDFNRRDLKFNDRSAPHTAQDIFLRAYMHTTHHRAQAIAYLRLKSIEPPRWRFPPNGSA